MCNKHLRSFQKIICVAEKKNDKRRYYLKDSFITHNFRTKLIKRSNALISIIGNVYKDQEKSTQSNEENYLPQSDLSHSLPNPIFLNPTFSYSLKRSLPKSSWVSTAVRTQRYQTKKMSANRSQREEKREDEDLKTQPRHSYSLRAGSQKGQNPL